MRFRNTVKTKISTEHGTLLKIITFEADGTGSIEYKVNPKCHICGGKTECTCFNDDNSDDPEAAAIEELQKQWVCGDAGCVVEGVKQDNPGVYNKLLKEFGDDKWGMADAIKDRYWSEQDQGNSCEVYG